MIMTDMLMNCCGLALTRRFRGKISNENWKKTKISEVPYLGGLYVSLNLNQLIYCPFRPHMAICKQTIGMALKLLPIKAWCHPQEPTNCRWSWASLYNQYYGPLSPWLQPSTIISLFLSIKFLWRVASSTSVTLPLLTSSTTKKNPNPIVLMQVLATTWRLITSVV